MSFSTDSPTLEITRFVFTKDSLLKSRDSLWQTTYIASLRGEGEGECRFSHVAPFNSLINRLLNYLLIINSNRFSLQIFLTSFATCLRIFFLHFFPILFPRAKLRKSYISRNFDAQIFHFPSARTDYILFISNATFYFYRYPSNFFFIIL